MVTRLFSASDAVLRKISKIKPVPLICCAIDLMILSTPPKQAEAQKCSFNLSKIPCRHFTQSPTYARVCSFGNECHYTHNVNERLYIFATEELTRIRVYREERFILSKVGRIDDSDHYFENGVFVRDIFYRRPIVSGSETSIIHSHAS